MSDAQDNYLWTGVGTPSDEVAALEHELGSLAWQPRALALGTSDPVALTVETATAKPSRAAKPATAPKTRRWSASLVAGFMAAAAVLMLAFWLRPTPAPSATPDTANPTAPPSPDLKDPFTNSRAGDQRGFTTPTTDPKPSTKTVSPDLEDPFAGSKPRPKRRVSPDLKDPFADTPPAPPGGSQVLDPFDDQPKPKQVSPDLTDPFGPAPSQPKPGKKRTSPDLKDPFTHD